LCVSYSLWFIVFVFFCYVNVRRDREVGVGIDM
jgi:hypothetical protein